MIRVRFIAANGQDVDAEASPGQSLLEVGQAAGLPLEGTCEGQMACSTCHVIVAEHWFSQLVRASDDEEDMIDLAAGATRYSRLACQIVLDDTLDGLEVRLPEEARNMQGR